MYNQQTLHKEEALALLQELFFLMYSHVIQFQNVILGTAHPFIHSGSQKCHSRYSSPYYPFRIT